MAMTSAERQRRYRQNIRREMKVVRLGFWIEWDAFIALNKLAKWSGQSRTAYLRALLLETQRKLLNQLRDNQAALDRYWELEKLMKPNTDAREVSQVDTV